MRPHAVNDPASAASGRPGAEPAPLPVRVRQARPGPPKPETSLMLGPLDTAPGDARATLRLSLMLWGLPHLTGPAEAICSELVTNAVAASREKAPPGTEPVHVTFTLSVEAGEGELCLRVWDPDPTPPPRDQALPADDAESGRGLFIVSALSSRWGWHPAPHGGKYVWSTIRLDAS